MKRTAIPFACLLVMTAAMQPGCTKPPAGEKNDTGGWRFSGASKTDPTAIKSYLVARPDELVVTLASGLTVIVKEHHAAPVATVKMYCKTGSIYEQQYLGAGLSQINRTNAEWNPQLDEVPTELEFGQA